VQFRAVSANSRYADALMDLTAFIVEVIKHAKMLSVLQGMYEFANDKHMRDDLTDDQMNVILKELSARKKHLQGLNQGNNPITQ
jgi:hypothetical protein